MTLYELLHHLHESGIHGYLRDAGILSTSMLTYYEYFHWSLLHPEADYMDATLALSCSKSTYYAAKTMMQRVVIPEEKVQSYFEKLHLHIEHYLQDKPVMNKT
ncbi:MAG: hypothetical protein NC038_03455 [Paludibacter sp.]|nr:hypothetical protein [Bacteroidales bacterium]MCM1069073.1 hypothetical protein [Prevotella sp.]MCM1353512.1 hypothetical protein [Bacteroides sp.]MCM1442673.1 hypothetical protein [Muribaculum sp.]MCM1481691.1 hypothetical protein [Paludibacter sp.]